MPRPDHRILEAFRNRLLSAISRSPLVKVSTANTGRLLDCSRLQTLKENLDKQVVKAVVRNEGPISIDLPWRLVPAAETADSDPEVEFNGDEKRSAQRRESEQKLLEQMLVRIMRYGALAKRETGIHAVWLGYPLLYVAVSETEPAQKLLAPVFLWPLSLEATRRHQGRYTVSRNVAVGPPQFNRAMATWIKNRLQFDLSAPSQDELKDLTWEALPKHLQNLAQGFPHPPPVNCEDALESIPKLTALRSQQSPRFFNSAVLGHFRWQNEAILADLNSIKDESECLTPLAGFISGTPLERQEEKHVTPPEEDRFLVCAADFSQERVIWKARSGPGLVVHGPPGTGKSQTIVNIISDALAHGRTVLMVCQKQAATRVVLERLRKVGLADLCMEVHDPESERVAVFKKIREQVQKLPNTVPPATAQGRRQQSAERIIRLKRELDRIAAGFHERHHQVGLSYRDIKAREGRNHNAFPTVRPLPSLQQVLGRMSATEVDQACLNMQSVGQRFKDGNPLNNPWRHHQPTLQVTPVTGADVKISLERLKTLDAEHLKHIEEHGARSALPCDIGGFADMAQQFITRLRAIMEHPTEAESLITLRWIKVISTEGLNQLQSHVQNCTQAVELSDRVARATLDPEWDQICSRLTAEQLNRLGPQAERVHNNQGHWRRFFSWSFYVSRRAIQRLLMNRPGKTIWEAAVELAACLKARALREQLAAVTRSLIPGVSPSFPDAGTHTHDPRLVRQCLEVAAWLCEQKHKFSLLAPAFEALSSYWEQETLLGEIQNLEQSIKRVELARLLMNGFAGLETYLTQEALEQTRGDVLAGKSIQSWLDRLAVGFKGLPSLLRWEIDRRQPEEPHRQILMALEDYERRRARGETLPGPPSDLPDARYGEWWAALVECAVVATWRAACDEKCPELLQFDPEDHEQKRRQLADLTSQKAELEAQAIRERWLGEQVGVRAGPWNQLFQLNGANAKRLRQAVELSLPRGLLKLRPCWLVDPDTAAQIFPLEFGLFDVVIFDEASQCPVEYAVPAIYRGKTLIVSGDAKQLPPTSFFSTRAATDQGDEEDDEEKTDATDQIVSTEDRQLRQINAKFLTTVEDLLDASIGNLPEDRLLVHYRSDHPRLIEFSNRAFYHGQLEAPPARMRPMDDKPPIQYHAVNGLYAAQTNRDEARKVVELLKNVWNAEGKCPSIGVVTFNGKQRDLIEDLLEKERRGDDTFDALFQREQSRKEDNQDVGFFVKNLENVQGDERDMMIFSTTFGRDATGTFYRRFGPVGQEKGERRLSVAITRAKHRIIVVSSMPIEQISEALGTFAAPGMNLKPRCYLQLYLAYARAVSVGDENQIEHILERLSQANAAVQLRGVPESPLEEEVLHELQKLGYEVDCQVGESGFRIDLAVRHAEPSRGYLLGIECDGATYHSDRAAHLRDVWRETILRSRGWKLHRIWSTHWWYHRADEIAKLLHALLPTELPGDQTWEPALTSGADCFRLSTQALQSAAESAPATESQAESLSLVEGTSVLNNDFMTLGHLRDKLTKSGEFRGSWERFLDFMKLERGCGLTRDMTLAEARRIVSKSTLFDVSNERP